MTVWEVRLAALQECYELAKAVELEYGNMPAVAARVIAARIATLMEMAHERMAHDAAEAVPV